jgi:hypothetical protein
MAITWDNVLAWRMHRHLLQKPGTDGAVEIVRRLCGVQAQVASSAATAVAVRQRTPDQEGVDTALAQKRLVKTWAMRGTLHLLPVDEAAAYLSLLASGRIWEKGSWQRTFATADQIKALSEAAGEALDGRVLTRDELVAELVKRTGDESLAEKLRSGWGAVLKPLAFQGLLCHGPSDGNRVTFARPQGHLPGWKGLPDPVEAAATVIPAYLGAYGPAPIESFDQWVYRGALKKSSLRSWFASIADRLTEVDVEGEKGYARAEDVDDIAAAEPSDLVRLLPAFDQYVLGPGTKDTRIIPAARRAEISKAAGWISPVVVVGGRIGGTWELADEAMTVTLWQETGRVSRDALDAEVTRIGDLLGRDFKVTVRTSAL